MIRGGETAGDREQDTGEPNHSDETNNVKIKAKHRDYKLRKQEVIIKSGRQRHE